MAKPSVPALKSRELSSVATLKRMLPLFPIGIGEMHTNPWGRAIVRECLKEGLVTNLFLELPESAQKAIHEILEQDKIHRILVSPEKNRGTAIAKINSATRSAYPNEIHYADLVIAARDATPPVPVWAAERFAFDRYDFGTRHTAIAECVKEKAPKSDSGKSILRGCLFLWGSQHFTSKMGTDIPLWQYFDSMYYFVAVGTQPPELPPGQHLLRHAPPARLPPRNHPIPPLPPR